MNDKNDKDYEDIEYNKNNTCAKNDSNNKNRNKNKHEHNNKLNNGFSVTKLTLFSCPH